MNEDKTNQVVEGEPNVLLKLIRMVGFLLLSIIQVIPYLEGWLSYILGSVSASFFTPISYLSPLWFPLDLLCKLIWVGCDWLKCKIENRSGNWKFSTQKWENLFPAF